MPRQGLEAVLGVAGEIADGIARRQLGPADALWLAAEASEIAKERRLFYVGVTRARHSLQLSWVRHRREWAGKPSRFLAEIPKPLIEGGAVPFSFIELEFPARQAAARRAWAAIH